MRIAVDVVTLGLPVTEYLTIISGDNVTKGSHQTRKDENLMERMTIFLKILHIWSHIYHNFYDK